MVRPPFFPCFKQYHHLHARLLLGSGIGGSAGRGIPPQDCFNSFVGAISFFNLYDRSGLLSSDGDGPGYVYFHTPHGMGSYTLPDNQGSAGRDRTSPSRLTFPGKNAGGGQILRGSLKEAEYRLQTGRTLVPVLKTRPGRQKFDMPPDSASWCPCED